MANNLRTQAEQLAQRPYSEVIFRDHTTDDEYIYVAMTPELEGCVAQGETLLEAKENLRFFRADYIEHLLENHLPVPEPASITAGTWEPSIVVPVQDPSDTSHDTTQPYGHEPKTTLMVETTQ